MQNRGARPGWLDNGDVASIGERRCDEVGKLALQQAG
jgi:hypothetical protein